MTCPSRRDLHERQAHRTPGRGSPAGSRLKDLDPQVLTIARKIEAHTIMYKHRGSRGPDVKVVGSWDGNIPHPALVTPGCPVSDHGGGATCRGAKMITVLQRSGLYPPSLCKVPEQVAAGRPDHCDPTVDTDLQIK